MMNKQVHNRNLQCRSVTVRVAGRVLLQDLTVSCLPGQRWALLGANGAGKTTLLMTLAGLRAPDQGQVLFDGADLHEMHAMQLARLRAFTEQQSVDMFEQTVVDFVGQARAAHDGLWQFQSAQDAHPVVDRALIDTQTTHLAQRDIRQLSGGERQRVAIAAALAQQGICLLLDEPMSFLDPAHQLLIARHLAGLSESILVMALHDVNLALRFCTHAIVLMPGQVSAGAIGDVVNPETLQRAFNANASMHKLALGSRSVAQVFWD